MRVPQLKLTRDDNSDFTDIPLWTSQLWIPLAGHKPVVKKGQRLAARQTVAVHPDLLIGDMHTPGAGSVEEIHPHAIIIAQDPERPEDYQEDPPQGVNFDQLADGDLPRVLKELGIDLAPLLAPCATMIINALPPEPPVAWVPLLLKEYDDLLEDALVLLRRLRPGVTFLLAAGKNKKDKAGVRLADLETVYLPAVYPNSLPPITIREVCRAKGLAVEETACLPLQQLYDLGVVAVYGLPLTETIVSVQMRSRVVNIGTPAGDIFTDQELELGAGDLVIFGGIFSGQTLPSLRQGVGKHVPCVLMMRYRTFAPYSKDPCVNCGNCVHLCPVGICPNSISRQVEKQNFTAAAAEGVARCIDCGLCGYICVARRPMQQWMKTAKKYLGLEPDVKFSAWDPASQTISGSYAPKNRKLKQAAVKGGSRG